MKYVIGIDFGTLSARGVLLESIGGAEICDAASIYSHGVMDKALPCGRELPFGFALQDASDYLTALSEVVGTLISKSNINSSDIVGIGIDFTSSTVLPIDECGIPLSQKEEFKSEPHAYVKLWKHHGAEREAEEITRIAGERGEKFLSIYGGKISCEWALPKVLETLRAAPEVYDAAYRFVEAGDWLSLILCGKESRSLSFAGYKWLWNTDDGYPCNEFFVSLDSGFEGFVGKKIPREVLSMDSFAGVVSSHGAEISGVSEGCAVAFPIIDAHAPMTALNLVGDGDMIMTLGTSGCYVMHSEKGIDIPGLAGYVKDSVVPGLYTYEAGQTSVGDNFDWFVKNCVPESYIAEAKSRGIEIHALLSERAEALAPGESGLISLDWFNGNRSVLTDFDLSGAILGLNLQTRPEEIYRALIEGVVFGTKIIFDTYAESGIEIKRVAAAGGIAGKNPMMMQIYADVLNMDIEVSDIELGGARGSAIYAAVAAGVYPSVVDAAHAFYHSENKIYRPNPERVSVYQELYKEYRALHDYFGNNTNIMARLKAIKARAKKN